MAAAAATPHQQPTTSTWTPHIHAHTAAAARQPTHDCCAAAARMQKREPQVAVQGHLSTSQRPAAIPFLLRQHRRPPETGREMYTTQSNKHPTNISWSQNRTTDRRAVTHLACFILCGALQQRHTLLPPADRWQCSTACHARHGQLLKRGPSVPACSAARVAHRAVRVAAARGSPANDTMSCLCGGVYSINQMPMRQDTRRGPRAPSTTHAHIPSGDPACCGHSAQ